MHTYISVVVDFDMKVAVLLEQNANVLIDSLIQLLNDNSSEVRSMLHLRRH